MTHKYPLVSVVIVISSHLENIYQSLRSVMEQSYPEIEMIIVNDGLNEQSSRHVEHLIKTWYPNNPRKRKITFIQQANQEICIAINLGLYMSSGDFLTILHSDDFYKRDRIETLVNHLREHHAEWVFTEVQGIDQKNNPLSVGHPWRAWYEETLLLSHQQLTIGFQFLHDNLAVTSGNLFFTRSLYEKVGEFNRLQWAYAHDYALRALLFSEPLFLNDKSYFYRLGNENQFYHLQHQSQQEMLSVYKDYEQKVSKDPPLNKWAPSHWNWSTSQKNKIVFQKPSNAWELFTDLKLPRTSPKKITLLLPSLDFSDASSVFFDLCLLLKKHGHKVNVVSFSEGPMRSFFESEKIKIHTLSDNHVKWHQQSSRMKKFKMLFSLIFQQMFNAKKVVIGCNTEVWPLFLPLALISPFRKFVWYILDAQSPASIKSRIGLKIFSKVKIQSNLKTWFASPFIKQFWQEDLRGEIKYWSGISLSQNQNSKATIKNILCSGSSKQRFPYFLVDAFIECIEKKVIPEDVKLNILGVTEMGLEICHHELLAKINKLGIRERIHIITPQNKKEMKDAFEQADLYIDCSLKASLPLILFQAMSKGLPIIAVHQGVHEIIKNETGYPCSLNIKALSEAIREAVNQPHKSFELGQEALKEFNENYCLEKTHQEILSGI